MALLTLSSLNFTYAGSTSPALKDVSLTVNEGDFILLCGNSGCGKTTLMRLIKPQLAPNGKLDGEILFDGKPLSEIDRNVFTGSLAVVDQDIILFEDTVANNIKMWDNSI